MAGESLHEQLLKLLSSGRSLTRSEMARALDLHSDSRKELRDALSMLEHQGLVVPGKKSRYTLRGKTGNQLVGNLRFHPKGHAWFYPDISNEDNLRSGVDLNVVTRIYIARRDTETALDGDRVLVDVRMPSPKRPVRHGDRRLADSLPPEEDIRGRVERVLERRSGKLIGVFQRKGKFSWVECDEPSLSGEVELTGDTTAEHGQLVVVQLEQWAGRQQSPLGRIIEVLGWPGAAGVDIMATIHRFGLKTSFPDEVLAETHTIADEPEAEEIARRVDWRGKLVITIDPASAKDHDDAIWVEKTDKGWQLAVHIADVSHYVKPHTALDREAVARGNSTYLVDRVLPMLPPELSNGICSLKPDVDRLTKCALMTITPRGEIKNTRFIDAVIHSRAKLSYEQAQDILDGKPAPAGSEAGLAEMVKEAWIMASALRKRRFAEGALDLEMPETRIRLDDHGKAIGIDVVKHTASHQLIEECMLAANEAVARLLKGRQKPAVYRVHEDPDFGKLADFTETAKQHGYRPGDLTNRAHIQQLLDESKDRPDEHAIKLGLLKSLKRAAYAADPLGHYGLAKADYCHFTSPIRRYADLIIHRALQTFLENAPPKPDRTPGINELREISRHISETERTSADAESETKQIKQMEYLASTIKRDEPVLFDGLISEARPMGLLVEVPDLSIRGAVRREDLPVGRWRFEPHRAAWVSFDGPLLQQGMRVPLHVIDIDPVRRFINFAIGAHTQQTERSFNPIRTTPPRAGKPKPSAKPTKTGKPSRGKTKQKSKRRRRR